MTLSELATKYGTDKGPEGHGYTEIYEEILSDLFVNQGRIPAHLLEIGVDTGASLRMWRSVPYLRTYAIDIDDKQDIAREVGFIFRQGDAHDREFLKNVYPDSTFDLVIDDGSHRVASWVSCVDVLLPRINPGGYLVIEDIHSWVDGWEGTEDADSFFTGLIQLSIQASPKHSNHVWKGAIEEVRFIKGLCIIRRAK